MKIPLGVSSDGAEVSLDLNRLIVSRLLLQANSGGGKSYGLRGLLEATCGHVQQIIIDVEDEFYTLREKGDYILARHEGGDVVAEVRSAERLALRVLELNISAIVSIYELSPRDRRQFVKLFLNALVNAPKKLWHSALIVLDEAHEFCPEQGRGTRDESGGCSEAVIGLMSKGRKRGFCGVLATQRISKLSKDAAAECNNKLIGRATIDVDRKRAADELGFTTKDQILSLRKMEPGQFFAFGPAICDEVTAVKLRRVETTHPKAGAIAPPIPLARNKVLALSRELADLPKEAEQERADVATLQRRIHELEGRIQVAAQPQPPKIEKVLAIEEPQLARLEEVAKQLGIELQEFQKSILRLLNQPKLPAPAAPRPNWPLPPSPFQPSRNEPGAAARLAARLGDKPSGKLRDIMVALAQVYPEGLIARQIGARARVSIRGGSFATFISRGRTSGWLEGSPVSGLRITEQGLADLGPFEPMPRGRALFDYWMNELGGKSAEIFAVIYNAYPRTVTTAEIGELANVSTKGGSFATFMSGLKVRDLITGGRGVFRAADELFE